MTVLATKLLARYAAEIPGNIPDNVFQIARRALTDTLGVAIAGSRTPVARRILGVTMGSGGASLLGTNRKVSATDAARCNGCAAHALDFDDNCYAGFVHGSAVIIPAALAVAQQEKRTGEDLIIAIVAGSECQYRLGEALGRPLYDKGWWTTGVLGAVGACVAAAYLLHLDELQVAHAIALALVAAGGSKSAWGSDAKAVMAGLAAERGVLAALMAQAGITGPLDVLEHATGIAVLMNNGNFDASRITVPGWRLLEPGLDVKRIPVCLSSHAAVDAIQHLVTRHPVLMEDIKRIHCDVPAIVAANLTYPDPQTPQQAQFSLNFAIAASLVYGELTLAQLDYSAINNQMVRQLMPRVLMTTTDRWLEPEFQKNAPEGARVTIYLHNGEAITYQVNRAYGNAVYPLSENEIDEKFIGCTQSVYPREQCTSLLARLRQIMALTSLTQLGILLENQHNEF